MLTSDLLRFKIEGHRIKPRYLTRKQAGQYLSIADDLIAIYNSHVGKSRKDLDNALDEYEAERVDYKIIRGLTKLLDGFAEFEPSESFDHTQFRLRLFEFAERFRPLVRQLDLVHQTTPDDVVQEFTAEYGARPQDLYGDLPEAQSLVEMQRTVTPEELLRRYNLALAQGILYRCHTMQIILQDSYKTVFRYLKLAQLMHKIAKQEEGCRITIDGPLSLFRRTQKYGVNMARFLPGLLLAEKWQMTAAVRTEAGEKYFFLDQDCGLVSTYKKGHIFDSAVEEALYKQFTKRDTEWSIERESEVVNLGDRVLIPDFKFVHPDGRQALLEIVGFWTPEYLESKLGKLRQSNREDLVIAVNENLNCSRETFAGPVLFYKTRVKVRDVLEILEAVTSH